MLAHAAVVELIAVARVSQRPKRKRLAAAQCLSGRSQPVLRLAPPRSPTMPFAHPVRRRSRRARKDALHLRRSSTRRLEARSRPRMRASKRAPVLELRARRRWRPETHRHALCSASIKVAKRFIAARWRSQRRAGESVLRAREIAAKAGHHLFVQDRRHRAAVDPIDDQAHRVGADIDDGRFLQPSRSVRALIARAAVIRSRVRRCDRTRQARRL